MSKINSVLLIVVFLRLGSVLAQNYSQCPEGKNSCGPYSEINKRILVVDPLLTKEPFNFILHQEIKRGSPNYSTGSFIAPNVIITAHHNVYQDWLIRRVSFCNKSVDKNKWITFKRREIEIIHFGNVKLATDISIIVIKNQNKIKELYKGCFNVGNYKQINERNNVHLTGFPCDFPDTLVDKSIDRRQLLEHGTLTLLGYNMYTCTGDSGAPLWSLKDGKPTIIGIHHGGNEGNFEGEVNCSAMITEEVLEWLKKNGIQ